MPATDMSATVSRAEEMKSRPWGAPTAERGVCRWRLACGARNLAAWMWQRNRDKRR